MDYSISVELVEVLERIANSLERIEQQHAIACDAASKWNENNSVQDTQIVKKTVKAKT